MRIGPVVGPSWVRGHLEQVVLADVRWFLDGTDARQAHREGHLPGAVFVDLDTDLAGPPTPQAGRHPLPSPEDFAAAMSRLGIGPEDTVVAYDQGNGAYAARLVWMLRVLGQDAALLDGGLAAWTGATQDGDVERAPANVPVRPWPQDRLADLDEVAALSRAAVHGDHAARLVDARAPERYRGDVEPVDPRAGHVPGAINVPFAANLDNGRLKGVEELRQGYADQGILGADDVVVYCGSGVTACLDILALETLGIRARLFAGSWSQWSSDPGRPGVSGPEPFAGGT